MTSPSKTLRIGELAALCDMTVETLRHYDEIDLLKPSVRSESNYRLYGKDDVEKLQSIVSLKQLGLPLEQIKQALAQPEFSPLMLVEQHLMHVREQTKRSQLLVEHLEGLQRLFKGKKDVPLETFLAALKAMQEAEAMYSEEEMEHIRAQGKKLGREGIEAAENEWPRLIAEATEAMEQGKAPDDPQVQELAKRWKSLVQAFTGGNPTIEAKLGRMYEEKPTMSQTFGGPDPRLMGFISKALSILKD